jgi:hypothetical protein
MLFYGVGLNKMDESGREFFKLFSQLFSRPSRPYIGVDNL